MPRSPIRWSFIPRPKDYTDVYARYGLLTDKIAARPRHPPVRPGDGRDFASRSGRRALPDLEPVSGLGPVRSQAPQGSMACARLIATDIGGGIELLAAQDPRRGLQDPAVARPPPAPDRELLAGHPRQCRGARASSTRIGTLHPGSDADIIALDAAARLRP
jgi:guanine deaminase